MLAFSVSFEWDYTNVVTDAAAGRRGAARRRARDRRDPLVVIGGAVTFVNPEPLALFADVIAAGEGEILIPALAAAIRAAADRDDLLRRLALDRGFYIPSFYDVRYAGDGTIAAFEPKPGTGAPPVVKKAAVKSTDRLDPPATSIFTPDTEFGSRFLIEVVRGCANLCRFCWAGYNYLPVRAFPADRILELAARGHAALEPRRPGLDRALRPPGDRADPDGPARHGLLDQPGVAAPRRSHRADRAAAARRAASARSRSRRRPAPIGCAA